MPTKQNSLQQTVEAQISRQKNVDKQICCVLLNNKSNLFINFLKMPIKQNSLQQTVEAQISRQKTSINKYVVFYQITNQTLL